MPPLPNVTQLLADFRAGNAKALDALFPLVYDELRRIAHRQLRRLPCGATLRTTALVHEAYLHLVNQQQATWNDRVHFFAYSATVMRHILISYARAQGAQKRGGGWQRVDLEESRLDVDDRLDVLLTLDDALTRLAAFDARAARVVELRFFGGLSEEEAARALEVSERTVRRDWRAARAFLKAALSDDDEDAA